MPNCSSTNNNNSNNNNNKLSNKKNHNNDTTRICNNLIKGTFIVKLGLANKFAFTRDHRPVFRTFVCTTLPIDDSSWYEKFFLELKKHAVQLCYLGRGKPASIEDLRYDDYHISFFYYDGDDDMVVFDTAKEFSRVLIFAVHQNNWSHIKIKSDVTTKPDRILSKKNAINSSTQVCFSIMQSNQSKLMKALHALFPDNSDNCNTSSSDDIESININDFTTTTTSTLQAEPRSPGKKNSKFSRFVYSDAGKKKQNNNNSNKIKVEKSPEKSPVNVTRSAVVSSSANCRLNLIDAAATSEDDEVTYINQQKDNDKKKINIDSEHQHVTTKPPRHNIILPMRGINRNKKVSSSCSVTTDHVMNISKKEKDSSDYTSHEILFPRKDVKIKKQHYHEMENGSLSELSTDAVNDGIITGIDMWYRHDIMKEDPDNLSTQVYCPKVDQQQIITEDTVSI